MKNIKTFEKYGIVNSSDLKHNWSAEYVMNKQKGLSPFKGKDEFLIK